MECDMSDFSERCRLCIEPKRLSIGIFSEEGKRIKLRSKIDKHLSVQVSRADRLPNKICYQCLFRLETWVSFKQLCTERNKVLKSWAFINHNDSEIYLNDSSVNCVEEETFIDGMKNGGKVNNTITCTPEEMVVDTSFKQQKDEGNCDFNDSLAKQLDKKYRDDLDSDWKNEQVGSSIEVDITEGKVADSKDRSKAEISIENESALHIIHSKKKVVQNFRKKKVVGRNRRKLFQPSKLSRKDVPKAGKKVIKTENIEIAPNPGIGSTSQSINCDKPSSPEFVPVKRKRGRPSKASLQMEKELKKKEKDDKTKNSLAKGTVQIPKNLEPLSASIKPSFVPMAKDSGMTEIVLDDPDFGSMKFTLSVIEIGNPMIGTSTESKSYAESCSSECGTVTSEAHLKDEFFKGFDSPSTPLTSPSRSQSLKDMKNFSTGEAIIPRKRSASCHSQPESDLNTDHLGVQKTGQLSKSLTDLTSSDLDVITSRKRPLLTCDYVAYSDGELVESNKRRRRSLSQQLLFEEQNAVVKEEISSSPNHSLSLENTNFEAQSSVVED